MTTYYLPDLTGQNPDYLQVNIPSHVFRNGQKIIFDASPVFTSSLVIKLTDGSQTPLVKDADWVVNPEDIDEQAMSRAFLENSEFAGQLIKSITIISNKALHKRVAMQYQEFYLTSPGRLFDDGTPFEVTPDLIKSLVTGLADVRGQIARPASPVAPIDHAPPLLPFDINGELSGNVIEGEVIAVNTVAGAKVIRLVQGAYFPNTLELKYEGQALNPTTDYLPLSVSTLTKQTTNPSGIYQYILLVKPITGDVTAKYHAVGGEVQTSDVQALYELMVSIQLFLQDSIFVTSETVQETPAFRALNARLASMETSMRNLLSGQPTYGDSTSGLAVRRPVIANDSNFHWYTIARLYKVQGSNDVIQADRFRGRVFFPGMGVALGFSVDVNLTQTRNTVSMLTESLVFDPNYLLFEDLALNAPAYPMLRLVWNNASQSFSGALLQVGISLNSLSDQMVVEDLSSSESCWILDQTNPFVQGSNQLSSGPSDSNFVLPDNATMWQANGGSSASRVLTPKYDLGYLVYQGFDVALSDIATTTSTKALFPISLPSYFPIKNIRTLVVTMLKPNGSDGYDVEIPLPNINTPGQKNGAGTFVNSSGETIRMVAAIYQDGNGPITVSLNIVNVNTASFNSNVDRVRYIRAKV